MDPRYLGRTLLREEMNPYKGDDNQSPESSAPGARRGSQSSLKEETTSVLYPAVGMGEVIMLSRWRVEFDHDVIHELAIPSLRSTVGRVARELATLRLNAAEYRSTIFTYSHVLSSC
jgi:hypothetical protein